MVAQNWVGCLLFKAITLALDILLLCPSTIGGLGPRDTQLRYLPKTVFCFEDLWRTLEEWCETLCSMVRKCLDGRTGYTPGRRWGWFIRDNSADTSQLTMNLDLELKHNWVNLALSEQVVYFFCKSNTLSVLIHIALIPATYMKKWSRVILARIYLGSNSYLTD